MSGGGSGQIKPDILAKNIEMKLPGFKISGQDLKSPTKDLVVAYFTSVMEEFGTDFGPTYNLHDISHAIKLYDVVASIFYKLGIRLFSFDDIVNPASKRTLQLFAIMDNFHSFADQQAREVSELQEKRAERMAALHKVAVAKEKLLQQENQHVMNRAAWREQSYQMQKHMEELKAAKIATMEKHNHLLEAHKIIEGKLASAKNSVDKVAASVAEMDGELSQLDRRIVTETREELHQAMAAVEAVLISLEHDLRAQNVGLQQRAERVRSFETELASLQASNKDLEQAWNQHCEEKETSASAQSVQPETESVEGASKLMQQQLHIKKKELSKLQKLHDKAKIDLNKKIKSFEDHLQSLKQEYEDFRKSQVDMDVELENVCAETVSVAHKKEEEIEAIKMENIEYEDAYERYKLVVKMYAEKILKKLQDLSHSLE